MNSIISRLSTLQNLDHVLLQEVSRKDLGALCESKDVTTQITNLHLDFSFISSDTVCVVQVDLAFSLEKLSDSSCEMLLKVELDLLELAALALDELHEDPVRHVPELARPPNHVAL